ncbi:cyclic pyranopterin monophosphate synthase MoaC [Pacificimonas sp. ICDLI1SI03]
MPDLTHLNADGAAQMVDISAKAQTKRIAVAAGRISMSAEARDAIASGSVPKGDVLAAGRIAGIMAAKKTSELIPLCHPLPLTSVTIELQVDDGGVSAEAMATTTFGTGVEMEAMTACSVALLTIYDMAKAIDKGMRIENLHLKSKSGGKSGDWRAENA